MSHAEKCPVCNGAGRVPLYEDNISTYVPPTVKTCHGCGGRGWVEVGKEYLGPKGGLDEAQVAKDAERFFKEIIKNTTPTIKVDEPEEIKSE